MRIAVSLLFLTAAWILLVAQVEPVPTWFYVFVWYPTLVLFDELSARRRSPRLSSEPALVASLLGWSAVIWLVFEVANFRLRNWYYVMLPASPIERWSGILLSFATVVPAVILAHRLVGVGLEPRGGMTIHPWHLRVAELAGVATAALALVFPNLFFPLIWGAVWLVADPFVYRRRPDWSLLGDLERGSWQRIVALLLGGLLIGFLWEFYNYWARGKWIYTVPWLEHVKLFEMPPFGFLGFPVFALEAWTLYHVLCVLGVAKPLTKREPTADSPPMVRARVVFATSLAAVFVVGTLIGMERLTISSVVPRVGDIPGIDSVMVRRLAERDVGTVFQLADLESDRLAQVAAVSEAEATALRDVTALAIFRGIGAAHAGELADIGVRSVCTLAATPAAAIWERLHRDRAQWERPTPAETRVWVRAATKACS